MIPDWLSRFGTPASDWPSSATPASLTGADDSELGLVRVMEQIARFTRIYVLAFFILVGEYEECPSAFYHIIQKTQRG